MSPSATAAQAARYKALKEEFVSNLAGGSIREINCVTAVAPVAVLLWSLLQARHALFTPRTAHSDAIEFLVHVVAILLATTVYASRPLLLHALLLAPAAVVYLLRPRRRPWRPVRAGRATGKGTDDTAARAPSSLPKRAFLTNYRGSMLVITSLAILAVDFRVFPRRFAKVETWGTSLMDVGVGSFVFSAGIVAARPLLRSRDEETGLARRLRHAARHSVPLFALGLIRLASVKGWDYAEHVSEYGVHWNFFFTLGFLPPFVALMQSVVRYLGSYGVLAFVLGAAYQITLDFTTLKAYILTAPRADLVSMNREGIFSFVGYLAIFLAGQGTGLFVLPRHLMSPDCSDWRQRQRLLITLGGWSLIWTLLFLGSTDRNYGLNLTVSRRLANLPYFLWITAFNTCYLTVFCVIETIFFPQLWRNTERLSRLEEEERYRDATSRVLEAFNRNGLALFLVANLLTGAVNLSISTIETGTLLSMIILVGYGAVITGIAIALDRYEISIKL